MSESDRAMRDEMEMRHAQAEADAMRAAEEETRAELYTKRMDAPPENLSPEAEKGRRDLLMTLISPPSRRMVSVFLGRDDYKKVEHDCGGGPMGALFMECLPRFVKPLGGEIVLTGDLVFGNGFVNSTQAALTIDGRRREFVVGGYLFVHSSDQRVAVHAASVPGGGNGPHCVLTVQSNKDSAAFLQEWENFTREHNYLRRRAFFADGELIERKKTYSWDDILLTEKTRQVIHRHVEGFLRNGSRLHRFGVKLRRGLILAGPPGTGKTLLGKILAQTLESSFIWVTPRHIETPGSFHNILSLARFVSPTVLFLEDLDLFAEDRLMRSSMGLGELMNQLDGAIDNENIITIATTNHLDVVEKALRNRPGRFDRILRFEAMEEACRGRFLRKLLDQAEVSPENMAHLVEATDGYTGAQIEELANTLYIAALDGNGSPETTPDDGWRAILKRELIDEALEEVQGERTTKAGFHSE